MSEPLFTCPRCGGHILGDGYTSPRACENADVPPDREPDASVLLCDPPETAALVVPEEVSS